MQMRFFSKPKKQTGNSGINRAVELDKTKQNTPFHSLSPTDAADDNKKYTSALLWALTNRKAKDIKNIALTGPYGSGKSSILKTFQANNKNQELRFLNISLATFKEENPKPDSPEGHELLRLIELSILQQIFYHENDEEIPDSRFKRIKNTKSNKVWKVFVFVSVFILSTAVLLNENLLDYVFRTSFTEITKTIIHYITLAISLTGGLVILFKSLGFVKRLRVTRFNLHDTEIEINNDINKSILNSHLDEILYFFEATSYTVVVIEDLDRFEQTEIFTKLRELNLLINNSKKINRDITFIYAVRDEMFQDKDRTKFFDFIIPVIPVINSSNSSEKLLEIINTNRFPIDPNFIDDISLFIDDMRLLFNIMNEYYVYQSKIEIKDHNKLLATIVYKNIFPNDFVELSNGTGKLYSIFAKKNVYIREEQAKCDTKIRDIKQQIKEIESIRITDGEELRRLYVLEYLKTVTGFISFSGPDDTYSIEEVLDEELFDLFISDEMKLKCLTHYYQQTYNTTDIPPSKFKEIEHRVDKEMTYSERLGLINKFHGNKVEKLKEEIEVQESLKQSMRHYTLADLLSKGAFPIEIEDNKQRQLISILLRNRYLAEDYLDYISIFYEGSITKSDREFLLNVKAQIETEYEFALSKIDKLLGKISPKDFELPFILNYSLLDFLLENSTVHQGKLKAILNQLKSESDYVISFIDGFVSYGKNLNLFIRELVKVWPGIWKYLKDSSDFTQEKIRNYLALIAEYADTDSLLAVAEGSDFIVDIANDSDFLQIVTNQGKLKNLIEALDIKFVNLNFDDAPGEMSEFVYRGNYYELNIEMVKTIIKTNGRFDENDFNRRNYFAIESSDCKSLSQYIKGNINLYIKKIYLQIETNIEENNDQLQVLLANEKIDIENRIAIIKQTTTRLKSIEPFGSMDIVRELFASNKLLPDWENLIQFFLRSEEDYNSVLRDYLEDTENAGQLSRIKVDINRSESDLPPIKRFILAILKDNDLSDDIYSTILSAIPYHYSNLAFEELSAEKVRQLIIKKRLTLSPENYNRAKEYFDPLHILLLEKNTYIFMTKFSEFETDENDIWAILNSVDFQPEQKNILINAQDDDLLLGSDKLLSKMGTLAVNSDKINLKTTILEKVLLSSLSIQLTVRLLSKSLDVVSSDNVLQVLKVLKHPYSAIAIKGKRPLLTDTQENYELADKLHAKGFIKNFERKKNGIRISTFRK